MIIGATDTNTGLTQEAVIFQILCAEKITSSCKRQLYFSAVKFLTHSGDVFLLCHSRGGFVSRCMMLSPAPSYHISP